MKVYGLAKQKGFILKPRRAFADLDHISAPIFVLEMNEDGAPVYAAMNAYALQKSGRPLSDYIGRTAEEVYPQAYGRAAHARHKDVIEKGVATTYQIDLPVGGETRTVRTTLRPERDATGAVVLLFGTSRDMTVEKQAMEAKIQFDTLSSEMEQFVALAAHDLRAPMRQIATLSGLLRDEFVNMTDDQIELLDLIENVSLKSMDLISDVLSHAEIGHNEAVETVFSFPALCQDVCDVLDPQGAHHITTSSATIEADRTALQIALRNLIENAMKHGGRDRLEIDINIQKGLPGMIEVTLTDNGVGFNEGSLKILNGGEFRVESGYGLFGMKRLISARGGTLAARNLPNGRGAAVRFSLPGEWLGAAGTEMDLPSGERLQAG